VGFFLLLLALVPGLNLLRKTCDFKTLARNALGLCAGFTLLAAPYLFYLRHETGTWTISGKLAGHMLQGGRTTRAGLISAGQPPVHDLTTAVVQLTKALRYEYEIFNLIFPPVFLLLVGLCLFRRRWTGERARRELYLFAFVAATLLGYAVTLPNIRFLVPLVPLMLCWLSQGVIELADWANETFPKFNNPGTLWATAGRLVVPLVVACLLASLLPLSVYLLRGDKWGDYHGQKRAAIWIKEHDGRLPAIMSAVSIPSYYAGGRHVALVDEDYAACIGRARREGAAYLLVNERDFKYLNPSLRLLLDEQAAHPGLRRVYQWAESPGHKIIVYALEADGAGAS
jgi:hypothetical protein